jgi:hypothetical protein
MKLIELFPLSQEQRQTFRKNYEIIQQEVEKIGREYEQKSYEELLHSTEQGFIVTTAEGLKINCSAEAYDKQKDGTICFCIDADGLPTIFSIKPSYHFYKRPDGSVYY